MVEITVEDGCVIRVDGLPPGYGFTVSDDGERGDDGEHASQEPTAIEKVHVWITWADSFQMHKEHFEFDTPDELEAFLSGVKEGFGYGDWEHYDDEAEADEAVADYNNDDEGDDLPGDIAEPVTFDADVLHQNVDAGRYTHFEHRQGVAQLKDDLVKIFGQDCDWGVSRLLGLPRESVGKEWFHDTINAVHKLVSLRADDAIVLPQYHLCGNCSSAWSDEQLVLPMQDLDQRLDPGSEVPSGDCPLCGAFCYICEKPKPA